MKLPSLKILLERALQTLRRFPLVLMSAAVATVVSVYMIEHDGKVSPMLENLLPAAALGIGLSYMLTVLAEKRNWSPALTWLAQSAGVLTLVFYYFTLPSTGIAESEAHGMRFLLFALVVHSLVSFAPYLNRGELNGFWQYNKNLLLRFLTAGFYSAALFIGLSIALLAVDQLFELNIRGVRYPQLFFIIAGLFNTWFFLAGAPRDFAALEQDDDYPKGLKVFTQHVLLPLVVIYLAILYAYEVKIILAWNWPKGWVANLVLFFSVVGILALLLLHPIQRLQENKWVSRFAKWYYIALIPLVAMLLLAIQVRINEYGFTESRYFVLVMGLALAVVVLYFTFSREKNIKIVPVLLCAIAFFSSFGPWGAFTISRKSQAQRFEKLLMKHNLLREGVIIKAAQAAPPEDVQQLFSIMQYLQQRHGIAALQPWFKENLDSLVTAKDSSKVVSPNDLPRLALDLMGQQLGAHETARHWSLAAQPETLLPIAGYESMLYLRGLNATDSTQSFVDENRRYTFTLDKKSCQILLTTQEAGADTLRFEVAPLIENLLQERAFALSKEPTLARAQLMLQQASSHIEAKIYFNSLNGERIDGKISLNFIDAEVLLRRR